MMRTSKKYTNATFTHRVDHEGGAHRGPRAPRGPLICERCGAMYLRRRWTLHPPAAASLEAVADPRPTICPACRMIAAEQFSGEVRISGAFAAAHQGEIERLIQGEARRTADDNPTARIVHIDRNDGRITVRTTTEHLAKRLGEALHKAFDGIVHYGFSHENKFAHVTWTRD
jgi:NMD protein affecting ribosome stability and mRNA decay